MREKLAEAMAAHLFGQATPEQRSTTLIAAPAFTDWGSFRDLQGSVDALLELAGLVGIVQVVGFHPDAVYEGADPDDPANATARAPVPVLHLLREAEVAAAVASHPDPASISIANAARLRAQGRASR